jgi:hypothetical protein
MYPIRSHIRAEALPIIRPFGPDDTRDEAYQTRKTINLIVSVYHKAKIFSEHMQSIQHWSEEGMRSLA